MNIPVPQINALFAPRPQLEYIAPIDTQLNKKRNNPLTGIGGYVNHLETGQEYDEIMKKWKPIEQRAERRERIKTERMTPPDADGKSR